MILLLPSNIIIDTVKNMSGLEVMIVFGAGLDEPKAKRFQANLA
jgi:hypothetical protein